MPHILNIRQRHRATYSPTRIKPQSWKRSVSLVLAVPIVAAAGAYQPSDDCAVLSRLAGNWTGQGTLLRAPNAEAEPVRCRLNFDWRPDARLMTSTMDCRGIGLDLKIWGSISISTPNGNLHGAFVGSEGVTNVAVSGRCLATALALHLKENKPKPGAPASRKLTITLSDKGATLTNLLESLDPDTGKNWRTMLILFKR